MASTALNEAFRRIIARLSPLRPGTRSPLRPSEYPQAVADARSVMMSSGICGLSSIFFLRPVTYTRR